MSLAAFVLVAACTAATECRSYEVESWHGPTTADLIDCANIADDLRRQGAQATCELVPMAGPTLTEDAPE